MAHLLNNVLFILNRHKIYVAMHCNYYVTIFPLYVQIVNYKHYVCGSDSYHLQQSFAHDIRFNEDASTFYYIKRLTFSLVFTNVLRRDRKSY